MKKVLSFLTLLLLSQQYVSAQGLKVVYEEVFNPQRLTKVYKQGENPDVSPEIRDILDKQLNAQTVTVSELLVNRGVSIYTRNKKPKEKETTSLENERVKATMTYSRQTVGNSAIYTNYVDSIAISQMVVGDKTYLLEYPVSGKTLDWTITTEQENILGYNCIKATTIAGDVKKIGNIETKPIEFVAWYCPDIPVNAGPDVHNGLPGLILKVEINKGTQVYTATSVEPIDADTEIPKLANGEKVSAEEFVKIIADYNATQLERAKQRGGTYIIRE